MGKEIERKFLVDVEMLMPILEKETGFELKQGYMTDSIHPTIRIRTQNKTFGVITIKGKNEGATRDEFEYFCLHSPGIYQRYQSAVFRLPENNKPHPGKSTDRS